MNCPKCGTQNPARARFCFECGQPLVGGGSATAGGPAVRPPEAERRQLTCLFSDLENSVQLSERLDPEDLRAVLAAYQHVCEMVIRRFEGYTARYFGDGILVYFGFPQAHEDEAQRAVRTALGIVEAVGQLNARLERERGIGLHVRVGIHTGLVVAGDIAPGEHLETMAAIGETPNIAARLQALAAPDSVLISPATYQLIAGYFDCRELGFRRLKGVAEPMPIYQVLHESGARTRMDVAAMRGLSPMAGRDAELELLTTRWKEACAGHGRAVLVTGEPGIGKSRLIWALQEHVAQFPEASLAPLTCSPYYQNTAFHPLAEFYRHVVLQFGSAETPEQRLDKIEGYLAQYGFPAPELAPLLADLLSVPYEHRYALPDLPADRRRQRTIEWIVRTVLLRSQQQPLLLVIEDLQWMDPSSLEVLVQLIQQLPSARQLIVLSCRPEFVPPWPDEQLVQRLMLNRLDRDASAAIVTEIAGRPLPSEFLTQLLGKAEGVPLFLEELTKLVLEQGLLREHEGRLELVGPVPQRAIPATLADSLTARLDRLADVKGIAQLGATIGKQFSYELLASVLEGLGHVDQASLSRGLDRLVEAGLVLVDANAASTTYTFKHALIQDAAYESLLHSTRQRYHRRIAEVLTGADQQASKSDPELIAYHYTQAGLLAEAIPWWLRAGTRARSVSANREAIAHLTTGLDLLAGVPDGAERARLELNFCLTLGPAYMASRGYGAPEVEACYARARELCRQLGDRDLAPILYGLWTYHIVRAQYWSALALSEQLLAMVDADGADDLRLEGNRANGWSNFYLGRLLAARENFERVLTLYDADRHASHAITFGDNPAISAGACLAQVLWLLGYPDQASRLTEQTLAAIRQLEHPYSAAFGLTVVAFAPINVDDPAATRAAVEEAIGLAEEHELPLMGSIAAILRGWALTRQESVEEGIAVMRNGLATVLRTGAELSKPYFCWLLAEAHAHAGATAEALSLLSDAETTVQRTDERYWEAEIYRLRGQLLQSQSEVGTAAAAEACYRRALEIARGQATRSLELRAAIGLAQLFKRHGQPHDAPEILAATYGWFTEGFSSSDLQEARALLADFDAGQRQARQAVGPLS